MFENSKNSKSVCDDKIFAQLTDLFGDTVPTEIILKTGQDTKWKCKYQWVNTIKLIRLRFKRQNIFQTVGRL